MKKFLTVLLALVTMFTMTGYAYASMSMDEDENKGLINEKMTYEEYETYVAPMQEMLNNKYFGNSTVVQNIDSLKAQYDNTLAVVGKLITSGSYYEGSLDELEEASGLPANYITRLGVVEGNSYTDEQLKDVFDSIESEQKSLIRSYYYLYDLVRVISLECIEDTVKEEILDTLEDMRNDGSLTYDEAIDCMEFLTFSIEKFNEWNYELDAVLDKYTQEQVDAAYVLDAELQDALNEYEGKDTEYVENLVDTYIGKLYSLAAEEEDDNPESGIIIVHTHVLSHVERVEATVNKEGNVEYWQCACGERFADANGTTKIEDVTIPRIDIDSFISNYKAKATKEGFKITWGKIDEADGYEVWASPCGKTKHLKLVATTENSYYRLKGNVKKVYKFQVRAYRMVDGEKVYITKSSIAHVAGVKNSHTNVKSLTVKVKDGKVVATSKKVKVLRKQLSDVHVAQYRYKTSNAKVATVDKNGKITDVGEGFCYIYVIARNGLTEKVEYNVFKTTKKIVLKK